MEHQTFIRTIFFVQCFLVTNQCLFKQRVGNIEEAKNITGKTYERKLHKKKPESPHCLCGVNDPNYRRYNLLHVYSQTIPNDRSHICMATPIASNLLLTSSRCLFPFGSKWNLYDGWPVIHKETQTLSVDKMNISSIVFKGFLNVTVKDVIYHPLLTAGLDGRPQQSDNDIAIIVTEENMIDMGFNTYCLPPAGLSPDTVLYQRADYTGPGGEFPEDNTTETRFVLDSVIMKAEECVQEGNFNISHGENGLCIRFRDNPPLFEGGSLTIIDRNHESPRYLVGIASNVGYQQKHSPIKYSFFTNLLPHIKYIEMYAEMYESRWCVAKQRFYLQKAVPKFNRSIDLYPWESPNQVFTRDESLDCGLFYIQKACGLRSEGNPYFNNVPKPPPPGKRNADFTPRISGGEYPLPYEYPWMINLEIHGASACGASIINDRIVLTAAHCVAPYDSSNGILHFLTTKDIIVWAHIIVLRDDKPLPHFVPPDPAIRLELEEIVVHPEFKTGWFKYYPENDCDIALLILKETISNLFSQSNKVSDPAKYRPICLPREGEFIELVGKTSHLAGWGRIRHQSIDPNARTDVLMKGEFPIRSLEECTNFTYKVVTNNVICATTYDVERSALKGDSGSPLSVEMEDGLRYQIGLTSFGIEYNEPWHPFGIHLAFFTNIQKFLRFIEYYATKYKAKWCARSKL